LSDRELHPREEKLREGGIKKEETIEREERCETAYIFVRSFV